MEELQGLLSSLAASEGRPADGGPTSVLAVVLMACFIGQAIAWVYQRTHSGLSYSMGFTQSLVTLTLGASLLVVVIGGSLITAFGLLGALAIVRFRNVLKDTRDTVFVLFALLLGMAIGTGRMGIALVGATAFICVIGWLNLTAFGLKGRFDGHVTFRVENAVRVAASGFAQEALRAFCRAMQRTTMLDDGATTEVVYAVHFRDPERATELATILRTVPGIDEASVVLRDRLTEL
jgi:hypothetical protein